MGLFLAFFCVLCYKLNSFDLGTADQKLFEDFILGFRELQMAFFTIFWYFIDPTSNYKWLIEKITITDNENSC